MEPDIISELQGDMLFYLTAGSDWEGFLLPFAQIVKRFVFADLAYQFTDNNLARFPSAPAYRLIEERLIGPRESVLETSWGFRNIDPGWLVRSYVNDQHVPLEVTFRRGFGQYALREIEDGAIKAFVHRGDSAGDGGSNLSFFRDYASDHPPCGHLLTTLSQKLSPSALIITDGSNTWNFLAKFHRRRRKVSSAEAYEEMRGKVYRLGPLSLSCVGYASPRYGPTLIWATKKRAEQRTDLEAFAGS